MWFQDFILHNLLSGVWAANQVKPANFLKSLNQNGHCTPKIISSTLSLNVTNTYSYYKLILHVSPEKHSYAWLPRKCDYQTDRQTDARQSDPYMLLCFACDITRAPRGTDRSPEYNEHFCYKLDSRVKNLTTEWNQKTTTLHNTCF